LRRREEKKSFFLATFFVNFLFFFLKKKKKKKKQKKKNNERKKNLEKVCKRKRKAEKLYWCWNINQLPVRAKPLKVEKYLPKQI